MLDSNIHANICAQCNNSFSEGEIVIPAFFVEHIFPNGRQIRLSTTIPTMIHARCVGGRL